MHSNAKIIANTQVQSKDDKVFKACIYLRLSKEDGDKEESNSISNQRQLLIDFIEKQPNIELVSERVDDGVSGATFDRPSFRAMIDDISNGLIDCVIVKDLSRFGRNYTESGKYIERVFPLYKTRFIAVNQNIDSLNNEYKDTILIAFLNLINDSYCRDTSVKIKKQLKVLREKGELIPSNLPYGYIKNDAKEVIVDEDVREVIVSIFNLKIDGYNQQQIAKILNERGVLSPLEYKTSKNIHCSTNFKNKETSSWSSTTVRRILTNEYYIGTLVLGKQTKPNHKVKKNVSIPKEEWIKTPNNHPPIISTDDFNLIQRLLSEDTRVSSNNQSKVDLFSSVLFCADCGEHLVKNTVTKNSKTYVYYICGKNRSTKECFSHRLSYTKIYDSVLETIKNHIKLGLKFEEVIDIIDELPKHNDEISSMQLKISKLNDDINKYQEIKASLVEQLNNNIININDYNDIIKTYDSKIHQFNENIQKYKNEIKKLSNGMDKFSLLIESFKENQNITELNRTLLLTLVDKIEVTESKELMIHFNFRFSYKDIINDLITYCRKNNILLPSMEVV